MVYKDISDLRPIDFFKQETSQASVLDRCFSFLIDYLLLSPIVSFVLIVFFKTELSIWRSSEGFVNNKAELWPIIFLLSLSYVFLFSLIQTISIYLLQATPGQHFLKLKMIYEKEDSFSFFKLWTRQIFFWLSFLFCGFPFLSILSDQKQKTFYDRLAGVQVVSMKKKQHYFSFETETIYWKSFASTVTVFLTILILGFGWFQHDKITHAAYSFNKKNKDQYFCQELKSVHLKDRLQTAIALNMVGQISDACVDKEADFALWSMHDEELKSLAYYGKSLTETDSDQEKKYLNQACEFQEKKYLGCVIAKSFLDNDLEKFYTDLNKNKYPDNLLMNIVRYEIGLTLDKEENRKNNFKSIQKYDQVLAVKKYLLSEILENQPVNTNQNGQRSPASLNDLLSEDEISYAKKIIQEL